jgi:phage terminase large subunit-like protein
MISWDPVESKHSPNRLDALVWAITDLLLTQGTDAPVVAATAITGSRT